MLKQPSYLLVLFSDGEPRTTAEFSALANVSIVKAARDISMFKLRGFLATVPRQGRKAYAITPEGMSHLRGTASDTKTSRILAAYQSGEALSYAEVESITGLNLLLVKNISRRLARRGLLDLCEAGERCVKMKLASASARVELDDDEPVGMDAETTIKTAMRSRPALEMFWGAAA
jgi:hypothetical protein